MRTLAAILALVVTTAAFGARVTDDFSAATNWMPVVGSGVAITNGQARGCAMACASAWAGEALRDGNQYAQVKIAVAGSGSGRALDLVVHFANRSGYVLRLDLTNGTWRIVKASDGAESNLVAPTKTPIASGDVWKLLLSDGVLAAYRNGGLVGSAKDAAFTSGQPELAISGDKVRVDDFEAGDLEQIPVHAVIQYRAPDVRPPPK